ncbi:MAG: nucleoid-associated protein [Thermodesulfobacteriota bacterium]|jgi:nucleoid-associated protein
MKVSKIIVHSLLKDEGKKIAAVDLSQNLLPIDDKSDLLIQRLDLSYKKSEIKNATFDVNDATAFTDKFKDYLQIKNDASFLSFSHEAVKDLKNRVQNISQAKGGFLVFTEYQNELRNYISVFLIRDTIGMLFKKNANTQSYVINPAEHLDLDKLAMACKIDVNKYHAGNGKYLSFIKRKMENISDYFINWISVKELESNHVYTDSLYQLINLVDLPVGQDGEIITREDFRTKVFDYVQSSPTKIININELSNHFYSHESHLVDCAEQNNITLDTEFQADGKSMRKFIRIDLDYDGIYIRFSRDKLQEKIRIDPQNKSIVIIESKKLATALRKEIYHNGIDGAG